MDLKSDKEYVYICDLSGASLHFCSQILPKKFLNCCREKSGYARFYFSENHTLIIQRYHPFSLKKLCQSKKNINLSKCVFSFVIHLDQFQKISFIE